MKTVQMSRAVWADMVLLSLIWGGSFLSIRIALDEVGVLTSVAHRVAWAALVLWGVVLFRRISLPRSIKVWGALVVMGMLNNVIPFTLMAWGQLHIETGLTAILNAATAIWGVLFAALIFSDERLTARRLIGVGLGFAGVTIAIGFDALAGLDARSLGQLAVLAGTISYALAGSWARATLKDLPPALSAAGMLTGSALVLVPVAWIVDGPFAFSLSPRTWGAIAYYALAATALAYLLYYRILAAAGAGNLLLVTLLIPPVAIVLGAVFRAEALSPTAYLGFVILVVGLLILDGRLGHWTGKKQGRPIDPSPPPP